jgi:hypothetical protein
MTFDKGPQEALFVICCVATPSPAEVMLEGGANNSGPVPIKGRGGRRATNFS